jgi:hypothetical protein
MWETVTWLDFVGRLGVRTISPHERPDRQDNSLCSYPIYLG